jgi:phosphoglucomutase
MITASHNPKNDNGYKVYWKNASQIIPPHDVGIAAAIENVDRILTWDDTQVDHIRFGLRSEVVRRIFDETVEAYFQSLNDLALGPAVEYQGPRFVYTPMHGVGLPFMRRAVQLFPAYTGSMHVVKQQAAPDPEFPTVPFPNPEENGALDLAKSEADRRGISFIIANDPDADRFAFAEKVANVWHQFSGNQIGILFGSYIFETFSGTKSQLAMLASTVSSRMLASMAEKEGFTFRETLTGFKWLGNVAQDLQLQGYAAVYAYEEAIGYMLSCVVWDKDGIAAATVFLKALLHWAKHGLTPWSKLQQLYERYGYFEDANTYLISPSPDTTNKVFQDIRKPNNGSRPVSVGGRSIKRWRDLTLGYDTGTADGKPILPVDASAQMITCELDDVVFTARGSGTEPKIKLYIEAKAQSSGAAKSLANDVLQSLLNEWFKPEYGLRLAGT